MMDICLLGTGGMMPLPNRWLTALLARYNGSNILIDCGEGTQITLRQLGWGFKNIDIICFTHYHGDHISGLPGLLLTIGNSDRTEPLRLIGPRGLKRVVEGLRVVAPELPFEILYTEITEPEETIQITEQFSIEALKVNHNITCYGYNLKVSRKGRFDVNRANEQNIPVRFWNKLQKGETIEIDNKTFTPDDVLGADRKGIKVSYITDTRPTTKIPDFVREATLFICEGMYAEREKNTKASEYKHMTFEEAAKLAKQGNVEKLWLTHFSPSLVNPQDYANVARKIFSQTTVGYDRINTELRFEED